MCTSKSKIKQPDKFHSAFPLSSKKEMHKHVQAKQCELRDFSSSTYDGKPLAFSFIIGIAQYK